MAESGVEKFFTDRDSGDEDVVDYTWRSKAIMKRKKSRMKNMNEEPTLW